MKKLGILLLLMASASGTAHAGGACAYFHDGVEKTAQRTERQYQMYQDGKLTKGELERLNNDSASIIKMSMLVSSTMGFRIRVPFTGGRTIGRNYNYCLGEVQKAREKLLEDLSRGAFSRRTTEITIKALNKAEAKVIEFKKELKKNRR